jgi:DNA-binding NarL/FixJ family response regulator
VLQDGHWSYIQRKYLMSPRELEIAKLVCRGLSNDQIASDLTISTGTVKTHLRNIYLKVRVNSKINMLLDFITAASHLASRPHGPALTVDSPKTISKSTFSHEERGISL